MLPTIDAAEASLAIAGSGAVLLDVREYDEWMGGHAPAATYIPMGEVTSRVTELPRDQRIVCVCRSGNRPARVTAWLIEWGTVVPFTVASLIGVVVGSRLASTRDSTSLQRWFVGLLVLVALYTAGRSGLALR